MILGSCEEFWLTAFLRSAFLHAYTPLFQSPLLAQEPTAQSLNNTSDVPSASLVQNSWWMMRICNIWSSSSEDLMLNKSPAFFFLIFIWEENFQCIFCTCPFLSALATFVSWFSSSKEMSCMGLANSAYVPVCYDEVAGGELEKQVIWKCN